MNWRLVLKFAFGVVSANIAVWIVAIFLNVKQVFGTMAIFEFLFVINYPAGMFSRIVPFGDEFGISSFIVYSLLQWFVFGFVIGAMLSKLKKSAI
jgi:hypothetical protein